MPMVNTYVGGPEGPTSPDNAVPGEQNQPSQVAKRKGGFCGSNAQPKQDPAAIGGTSPIPGVTAYAGTTRNISGPAGRGMTSPAEQRLAGINVNRQTPGTRGSFDGPGPLKPWVGLPRGYRQPPYRVV